MKSCLTSPRIALHSRQFNGIHPTNIRVSSARCQSFSRKCYANGAARHSNHLQHRLVYNRGTECSSTCPRITSYARFSASSFSSTVQPSLPSANSPGSASGSGFGKVSDTPPTDFAALDVLGDLQGPAAGVEVITNDGFKLSNGIRIAGAGVMLIDGEAFKWRPWLARGYDKDDDQNVKVKNKSALLKNARGQWQVHESCWGLLDLVWPKPGKLLSHFFLFLNRFEVGKLIWAL